MSIPPAADAMNTGLPCARSSTIPKYSSRAIGSVSSTSKRCTMRPSGPVWCVTSRMPSIFFAISAASSGVFGDFDAAALAAPAGVNLRFDDHAAADLLGRRFRLIHRERNFAPRHRDSVLGQDRLGLILVNFHGVKS